MGTIEGMEIVFLDNEHTSQYYAIIEKARAAPRVKGLGFQRHHIIPKCFGGSDRMGNLVLLTYEEHYHCHRLLTLMTTGKNRSKMVYAFFRFKPRGTATTPEEYAEQQAFFSASTSGSGNSFFGKRHSDETRQLIKDHHGMRGKSCYDVWVQELGEDEANQRQTAMLAHRSTSMTGFKREPHTEDWKVGHAKKMTREGNPNFGKIFHWVSKDGQTKRVEAHMLQGFLDGGWVQGRVGYRR